MAAYTVDLPEDLARFVEEQVASGAYPDAAALLRAGVTRVAKAAAERGVRERAFDEAVQVGLDQLERGQYIEIDDVSAYCADVLARSKRGSEPSVCA